MGNGLKGAGQEGNGADTFAQAMAKTRNDTQLTGGGAATVTLSVSITVSHQLAHVQHQANEVQQHLSCACRTNAQPFFGAQQALDGLLRQLSTQLGDLQQGQEGATPATMQQQADGFQHLLTLIKTLGPILQSLQQNAEGGEARAEHMGALQTALAQIAELQELLAQLQDLTGQAPAQTPMRTAAHNPDNPGAMASIHTEWQGQHSVHFQHSSETTPPEPDRVAVTQGRIWGDPHFVGADGGKYDVQGEAGRTYNILSDQGVQMNATFKEWNNPGTTVVERVGISTGDHTVEVTENAGILVDGQALFFPAVVGQDFDLPHGLGTTKADGSIEITAGEYTLTFNDFQQNDKAGAWINNIDIRSENANADGVLPHGLWGVTVDGDGQARNGDKGKGKQGGGAIEGVNGEITQRGDTATVELYEVDGLFDTGFQTFNKFNPAGDPAPASGGFAASLTLQTLVYANFAVDFSAKLNIAVSDGLEPDEQRKHQPTTGAI